MVQIEDRRLQDRAHGGAVSCHKCIVVKVGKEAHDKLAVESVHNTAMARDGVAKILNLEAALKAWGKEASKGSNQRRKGCQNGNMEMNCRERDTVSME